MNLQDKPWQHPLPEDRFRVMRDILAAPSPVGLEAAMTLGVLAPYFKSFQLPGWTMVQHQGSASVVWDSHPGEDDRFTVMLIGHADKIRMQVRRVGEDGKVWINSDSFLPCTLIGHEVSIFSEDPDEPGSYRRIDGGTVEALGAIHFSEPAQRSGEKGIQAKQLYIELQVHGDDKKRQLTDLGIKPGDTVLLNRPIKRSFSPDTFYGAYLDNGLGCYVVAEIARMLAEAGGTQQIRCQFAIASHEEIGRMGSRVLAGVHEPDVIVAVDVNHDFVAAPNIRDRNMEPLAMGKGFTLEVGSIVSEQLNARIKRAAAEHAIPLQLSVAGRDTGTDGMAAVFAAIDCAATSVGFPIRNMHTISESGHTGDVLAAICVLVATIQSLDQELDPAAALRDEHPRLDQADPLTHPGS